MLIGARLGMSGVGGCTAKCYIQNGLLAMWDATENVGFGRHDASTPIWYDLTGNGHNFDLTASSVWSFEDNKFVVPDATNVVTRRLEGDYDAMKDGYTFEAVVMVREPDVADYPKALFGVGEECQINYYCNKTNYTLSVYYSTYGGLNGTGGARACSMLVWGSMPRGRPCVITVRWDAESSQTSVFINGILMHTVAGGGLVGDKYANRVGYGLNSSAGYGSTHGGNNANYGKGPTNGGNYYSFRVYRRVLSDEEVAANFDIDNARFGLVG